MPRKFVRNSEPSHSALVAEVARRLTEGELALLHKARDEASAAGLEATLEQAEKDLDAEPARRAQRLKTLRQRPTATLRLMATTFDSPSELARFVRARRMMLYPTLFDDVLLYRTVLSEDALRWGDYTIYSHVRLSLGLREDEVLFEATRTRYRPEQVEAVLRVANACFDVEHRLLQQRMEKLESMMAQRNEWECGYQGRMMTRPLALLIIANPERASDIARYVTEQGDQAEHLDLDLLRRRLQLRKRLPLAERMNFRRQ
jgi:hypothetical protein